jgi:hypothetical protein
VHQSRGPVSGGPRLPSSGDGQGAHRSSASRPFLGAKTRHGSIKSERGWWRSSPRSPTAGSMVRGDRRWRGVNGGIGAQCWATKGAEKWRKWQHKVQWVVVVLGVPFIGSGRRCRGGEAASRVVMAAMVRFQSGARLWEGRQGVWHWVMRGNESDQMPVRFS